MPPRAMKCGGKGQEGEGSRVNGVHRFNRAHAILLIVSKSLIKQDTYTLEDVPRDEIPILEIATNHRDGWKVYAAGGQHRLEALAIWFEKKKKQLDEFVSLEQSIVNKDVDEVDANQLKKWNEEQKAEKDKLEAIITYEGQWLVSLFDDSKINETLTLHIAKNETKHVYMESPMEGLIQFFKAMKSKQQTFRNVKAIPQSKGNASKQHDLLRQDYVWEMLTYFDSAGVHFWHVDFMVFSEFYVTMFSSYGGILAYMVRCLERRFWMCFNSVELDEKSMRSLLAQLRSKDAKDANIAQEQLDTIVQQLKDAKPIPEAYSDRIRTAIDECFKRCIKNMSAVQEFGNQSSSEWMTSYAQYASEVPMKMQAEVDDMATCGDLSRICPETCHALKTCAIKRDEFAGFPLMPSSIFKVFKVHLQHIQHAILELSSWWTPFVYTAKIHPKEWTPRSASADLRCAIFAHPQYHVNTHDVMWDKIVLMIFEHYPALLNMEGQLMTLNVPDRSISQAQLLAIFGLLLSGGPKPSKKAPSVTIKGKGKAKKCEDDGDEEFTAGASGDDEGQRDGDPSESSDDDDEATPGETRAERLCDVRKRELKLRPVPVVLSWKPLLLARHSTRITTNTIPHSFQGYDLIHAHTWEWATLDGPSRTRILRILACLSIYEACAISEYHPQLLSDPQGSTAFLHNKIEADTAPYHLTTIQKERHQTTLSNIKQRPTKVAVSHPWADGIPTVPNAVEGFDLHTELARHTLSVMKKDQQAQLQRIIQYVQTQTITWVDTTNTMTAHDKPDLHPDVQSSLKDLVAVCAGVTFMSADLTQLQSLQVNAWNQRLEMEGLNPSNAQFTEDVDGLNVIWNSTAEERSKLASQRKPFIILSCSEVKQRKPVTPAPVQKTSRSVIAGRRVAATMPDEDMSTGHESDKDSPPNTRPNRFGPLHDASDRQGSLQDIPSDVHRDEASMEMSTVSVPPDKSLSNILICAKHLIPLFAHFTHHPSMRISSPLPPGAHYMPSPFMHKNISLHFGTFLCSATIDLHTHLPSPIHRPS
ncbi:hypothetical protein M404DRAFT_34058 [Pisolithus tinctorius Marx 270]|uniref:Uncharacterized protein n=1 Tax=Pisolithus tinctorius Marx 270 TaxID=870435 RepID=A0A0C3NIK0_PISTI|nr:hypothetical protein M404DRAFT_34058 [Pisolithus tinctorius Marx 270]